MTKSDEDRIRAKAHELWVAEGHPHGREDDHWVQAREIIAIEDSQASTLLPADTGAGLTIEEPEEALRNLADFPNLTDQGENLLTSTDREPFAQPSVEVPVSDQPGIAKSRKASKPKDAPEADKPAAKAKTADSKPAEPAKKAAAPDKKAAAKKGR